MSVASDFRTKWAAIMNASDGSRGQDVDARYAAMAKAADAAGFALVPKEMLAARLSSRMPHPETCPCTNCT